MTIVIEEEFRLWLRSMLEKYIGDDEEQAHHFYIPWNRWFVIASKEIFRYLMLHYWRGPKNLTADILKKDRETTSRAINEPD